MEAVPRLPMLNFDLKISPENTEFGPKLKQYIRDFYHEDPDSYTNEIHELEGLRAAAIRVTKDLDGCALLKRYFCQLQFLQSRFPIQEDGVSAVPYYWQDNYSSVVYCTTSVLYELASILHNIGAVHTQLGSLDPRTSAEGLKMACTHFQCASWAFQHLKDTLPRPRASDMAPDFMQLYSQICLAQAQECILEKSMMDNRKTTIIAKVAAHVVEYYNLALEALTKSASDTGCIADTVGSKQYKNWQKYLSFKAAYYSCVTLLYQGQTAEEQQKMGERLAYYQAAAEKLIEAAKLSKGLDGTEIIAEALQFTQDVVEGKKKAAHNDNEFIYHEKVPDRDSLTMVKGASLVKGIPFTSDDPEVAGPDIFARLVPLKAHEASSLYSEEKAKLLRRVGTQVDEKDTELAAFMASLQLETLNYNANSAADQLPQELIDACADLSERPEAIQDLVDSMNKLAETYHDVEGMLQDIDQLLQEEESKEQQWRSVVGVARPPSIAATELTREAGKYREAHVKAGESNQTLHRAMELHVANLRTLAQSLPDLIKQLPQVTGIGAENEEDRVVAAEVQTLVNKVKEMSTQRVMLINQLRESVLKDDITTQLVTTAAEGGALDVVFDKELAKHQPQISIIEQNLSAQPNILRALTDAYARYAPARKAMSSALRKRQATTSSLLASYTAREDLLAKASKGLEFYRKLENSVSRLLARVRSVCRVQQEERDQQQQASGGTSVSVPGLAGRPHAAPTMPDVSMPDVTKGPKLKDYLQSMKAGGGSPALSTNNASANVTPSVPYMPTSTPSFTPNPISTSSEVSPQWPPSVRPTPVGSEGTDTSVCSGKLPPISTHDLNKPSNLHYQYPGKPLNMYNPQGYPPYVNPAGLLPKVQNTTFAPTPGQYTQSSYTQPVTTTTYSSNYSAPTNTQYGANLLSSYPAAKNQPSPYMGQQVHVLQASASYTPPLNATPSFTVPNPSTTPQAVATTPTVSAPYTHGPGVAPPTRGEQAYGNYPYYNNYAATSNVPSYPTQAQNAFSYPNNAVSSAVTTPSVAMPYQSPAPTNVQPNSTTPYSYSVQPQQSPQTNQVPSATYNAASNVIATPQPSIQSNPTYAPGVPGARYNPNVQYSGYSTPQQLPQAYVAPQQDPTATMHAVTPGQQYQQGTIHPQQHGYQQPGYAGSVTTPQSAQNWNVSNYNTSSVVPTSSQYTSAGRPGVQQTNTAQTGVGGQTFAAQYQATTPIPPSSQPQAQSPAQQQGQGYYSAPYYGYHYPTTGHMAHPTPQVISQVAPQPSLQQPQPTSTFHSADHSSKYLTYMQARMPESAPHTTCSGGGDGSSNVDLLSGLDFAVITPPLEPQTQSRPITSPTTSHPPPPASQNKDVVNEGPTLTSIPAPINPAPVVTSAPETTTSNVSITPLPITGSPARTATPGKEAFDDPEVLSSFVQEVERLEKTVESLPNKTLNGPTPLEIKWKELQDLQEKDAHKRIISVARCYPMKNRFPDILPYDHSRVALPSTKDDYINASHIKSLSPLSPDYIVTQAPLPSTFKDFWTMVWEQQTELVICLLSDAELNGQIYWPAQKGEEIDIGRFRITLTTVNAKPHWTERLISMMQADNRVSRIVVHLQFTTWPGSSFPASPSGFLSFVAEGLSQHAQQRNTRRPVVVHCLSGVGRSGLYCLLCAEVAEIRSGHGIQDVVTLASVMSQQRGSALRDRQHLLFAYQAVLYYCQDLLMKRGILTSRSTFDAPLVPRAHARHPSEDFLLGPANLSQLQSGMEKMGLDTAKIDLPKTTFPTDLEPQPSQPIPGDSKPKSGLAELESLVPDPSSLRPNSADSKPKMKSSREDFEARRGSLTSSTQEPEDPLSKLDPLWSLK